MGFGEGYLNVQLLTQKLIDPPVIYDIALNRLVANPKIIQGAKWKMYKWYVGNIFVLSVTIFSAVHLASAIIHYNDATSTKADKEEIFVYIFATSICIQAMLTWEMVERDAQWFADVEAQMFQRFSVQYKG